MKYFSYSKFSVLFVVGSALTLKFANCEKPFHLSESHNFISDPIKSGIDFSNALPGPDGTICIKRHKYIDKIEKDQLKECLIQNVTQCYYTYVTEYNDAMEEKCDEFYWKSCKIVFESRTFNATTRKCKRPLIKDCNAKPSRSKYGVSTSEDNMICKTFYQTECNTTDLIPEPGVEPVAVTFCNKIPRKICAPDNCRVVEGPEKCEEETAISSVEEPIEICDLQPQQHCRTVKVSVPKLIPEKRCRKVEKQICNTHFVNPHTIEKAVFIKYCTKPEKIATYEKSGNKYVSSYLPPSSAATPPPVVTSYDPNHVIPNDYEANSYFPPPPIPGTRSLPSRGPQFAPSPIYPNLSHQNKELHRPYLGKARNKRQEEIKNGGRFNENNENVDAALKVEETISPLHTKDHEFVEKLKPQIKIENPVWDVSNKLTRRSSKEGDLTWSRPDERKKRAWTPLLKSALNRLL